MDNFIERGQKMKVTKHMEGSSMITGSKIVAGWKILLFTVLLLTSSAIAPIAHAENSERIIVLNSRLVGRDAAAQDVVINLLIIDGNLIVVTKDELVIEPGDIAVDSSGGFLFGQLVLGTRPSFVILDQDPRENVDALLDTKTHVQFAIRKGVIIKNDYPAKSPSPAEATPKPRLWKAYTPPPIAVPIRLLRQQEMEQV